MPPIAKTATRRLKQALIAAASLCVALLCASPSRATTIYHYTFTFDTLGFYADNSVTMTFNDLFTTLGQTQTATHVIGSINGYVPTGVMAISTSGGAATGFSSDPFGTGFEPGGTVIGFYWYTDPSVPVNGPGVYHSADSAGRGFSPGVGGLSVQYTSGYLFVTPETFGESGGGGDPGPGPGESIAEPAAIVLLAANCAIMGMLRLRRSRIAAQPMDGALA